WGVAHRFPLMRVARHLGAPVSDRIGLMIDPGEVGLAIETLRQIRVRRPVAYIELSELYAESTSFSEVEKFVALDCAGSTQLATSQVPTYRLSIGEWQKSCLPPQRKAKLSRELRRSRRRAEELGAVLRRVVPSGPDGSSWIDEVARVEAGSWKGLAGVGLFSDEIRAQWMRSALLALA